MKNWLLKQRLETPNVANGSRHCELPEVNSIRLKSAQKQHQSDPESELLESIKVLNNSIRALQTSGQNYHNYRQIKQQISNFVSAVEPLEKRLSENVSEKWFVTLIQVNNLPTTEDCKLFALNALNLLIIKGQTQLERKTEESRELIKYLLQFLKNNTLAGQTLLVVGNMMITNSNLLDLELAQHIIIALSNTVFHGKSLHLYRYSFWLLRVIFNIVPASPATHPIIEPLILELNLSKIHKLLQSLHMDRSFSDSAAQTARKSAYIDFMWLVCFISDHFDKFETELAKEIINGVFMQIDQKSFDFLLILVLLHFVNACQTNFEAFCAQISQENLFTFLNYIADSKNSDCVVEALILAQNYCSKHSTADRSQMRIFLSKANEIPCVFQPKLKEEIERLQEMCKI